MQGSCLSSAVRTLSARDIPSAVALSNLAGWNQTQADWQRLLDLDREACFALECDGSVVATATLTCYQRQFAWLGMVLTHPSYRRRGFARKLVESALELAEARRIPSIKLDATEYGSTLYSSLGFREEQGIERWSGPSRLTVVQSPIGVLSEAHWELDGEAFGADRSAVLKSLSQTAFIADDGFAFWRHGVRASCLGPCVARSSDVARRLIESCLSSTEGTWYWDLLPANSLAVKIAQDANFQLERKLVRMVKGASVNGGDSKIYAASGFELG
jgi:GNAT superfamily N-acetyltransferase